MNAILFVQFKDSAKAGPLGFSVEYPYPVYHIDSFEDEGGSLSACFLLANREGNFCWVDQADVKRVKGQTQNGGGRFQKSRKFEPHLNGSGGNRRESNRFGDQRYQRKEEYPPQEQYVTPEKEQQES